MQDTPDTEAVKTYLKHLQSKFCTFLEKEDSTTSFREDKWERERGGGGISRVLSKGEVFEKAGVNFSDVMDDELLPSATAARPELSGYPFRAMGVSLVVHPRSPLIPTVHANFRFFQVEKENSTSSWWFGGGFDLTPFYGFEEDAVHWHRIAREACDPFGTHLYPTFKANSDNYFYNRHRKEARGIGGLFFDDFNERSFQHSFDFVKNVGDHFIPAYQPIVARRKKLKYTEAQRQFQLYRRGRYVEFNLIYDRGTLFGLQSGGRVESILMSLPPLARWEYNWSAEPGSPEDELLTKFLQPKDWLRTFDNPTDP